MDMKDQDQQKPYFSILQGSEFYFNKILSRTSAHKSGEGVPFKWEMQPGIPKINDPPTPLGEEATIIPTPSPSPLMQNLLLPKPPCPCSPKSHSSLKDWLRRAMKKIKGKYKIFQSRQHVQFRSNSYEKLMQCSCSHSKSSNSHVLCCDNVDWLDSPTTRCIHTMEGQQYTCSCH
ncbi:hypothetical protein LIER_16966 [Lithospermum erythrorhizon]|uniref:Uncharacterized protein n=1 Tax=Lithospermum erythrorhizon TaxID=34254 RepID=A0AAV3Q8W4_LITER